MCGRQEQPYYLKEGVDEIVNVTTNEEEATKFSMGLEKAKHPTEFTIHKFMETGAKAYLHTNVSFNGKSDDDKPPRLLEYVTPDKIRMSLKDPAKGKHTEIDPVHWLSQSEWLFIRCARRKGVINGRGKLCIKKNPEREFQLFVVPSSSAHNNPDTYMRFCLKNVPTESFKYQYELKSVEQ